MIRSATKDDASRIAEILIFAKRTAYRHIFKNDRVSFGEMQVLPLALDYLNTPQSLCGVYLYDDEFVKGMLKISAEHGVGEIVELYVDPFFQKCHIGGMLLDFAENHFLDLGLATACLWVLEKNSNARAFYEKHGFAMAPERKLQDGTPEYIVKYQKSL